MRDNFTYALIHALERVRVSAREDVVRRRSFRLKRADVISIAVSLVIAVALFFALPM